MRGHDNLTLLKRKWLMFVVRWEILDVKVKLFIYKYISGGVNGKH
jgi:hypothetical protein